MSPPTSATTRSDDPLHALHPSEVVARWESSGLADLPSVALVRLAGRHLAVPRRDPADSFVLHAPLELAARAALLDHLDPADRRAALQRIAWVAATYGYDPIEEEVPARAASARYVDLAAAIDAGELDDVLAAATTWLRGATPGDAVAGLADLMIDRLSAAGHAPIFLYLLPRLSTVDVDAPMLGRVLLREMARWPHLRLSWMDRIETTRRPSGDLGARLSGTFEVTDPGSNFIHPIMSVVEQDGLAADVLTEAAAGLTAEEARTQLLRVAAWSMLQDDSAHAPYGWSHTLTMTQGALGIADRCSVPQRAIDVAATFVLGFRAALGSVALDPSLVPEVRRELDPTTFLDAGPAAAASALWHASDVDLPTYLHRLTSNAAQHEDAHLAKYTLACLDATREDPAAGRLYLSAAAHLAGWWRERDGGAGNAIA